LRLRQRKARREQHILHRQAGLSRACHREQTASSFPTPAACGPPHHLTTPASLAPGAETNSLFSQQPFRKEALMNLTISGHHLEVTPALREYVLTKLDRVTRHFDQVVDVNVLLTVEKLKEKERRQRAEVTLHVKGKDIFVEQSHEDLYAAIDQLMDKLDRQVCRHKDRMQDHHHTSPKRMDAGVA
jgi:putative sigma-54 modulation protein